MLSHHGYTGLHPPGPRASARAPAGADATVRRSERFGSIRGSMRKRLLVTLFPLALIVLLALAPVAGAYNDGRGFYGPTNELAVTNTGFILIGFFPLFIFVMSMIQRYLEKRKDARKAAQKALTSNGRWRGGW
jgi:hypothetical protein